MRGLRREIFKVILLDGKNTIIKDLTVSEGSLTLSVVHPREAFGPAVRESAAAVIFVHNHPSGDPAPSDEDIALTQMVARAASVLGTPLVDHVIVGGGGHASLFDLGLLEGA